MALALGSVVRRPLIALPLLGIATVLVAVGWYLVSPLFITRSVNEAFPVAAPRAAEAGAAAAMSASRPEMKAPPVAATAADAAAPPQPTAAGQPATAVAVAEPVAAEPTTGEASVAEAEPAAVEPPSAGPKALAAGTFNEIDAVHKGSGLATIYQLEDGSRVLRLEDFQVTNGPDLYVVLTGAANPTKGAEVHDNAYLELSTLKGNVGSQNYELPADVDLGNVRSVVIYCKQFSVVFSVASLTPAS